MDDVRMDENRYRVAAQLTKAHKLARVLRDLGVSPGGVWDLDEADWAQVARSARCQPPHSSASILYVEQMLERQLRMMA